MEQHGSHDAFLPSETGESLFPVNNDLIFSDSATNLSPEVSEVPGSEHLTFSTYTGPLTPSTPSASETTSTLQRRRQRARVQRQMAAPIAAAPSVVDAQQTPIEQTLAEDNEAARRAYEYLSSQIQQEMQTLRAENASLQYRVAVFQQLFQNKERLVSLLRSLGFNASVIDPNN